MKQMFFLHAFFVFAVSCASKGKAAPPIQEAYIKASDVAFNRLFGYSVAVSGDTMAVGQNPSGATEPGGVYIFVRSGSNWTQEAYLQASNPGGDDQFGYRVAISGNTVVVGAFQEDSNATGVNGDGNDNSAMNSGAAYVFVRNGTNWTQQAYLKASNTETNDYFGRSVAVDGDTVIIGANQESSSATGANGDQSDNSASRSGAAYIFVRNGTNWTQQAYLKASNAEANDEFGMRATISGDTVVVAAWQEDSSALGVNGDQLDNGTPGSGAAYVFVRNGTNWIQQSYLKASNTGAGDRFGVSISISQETIVVGAYHEDSSATGVNGMQNDDNAVSSGAAYVFIRSGTNWTQQAYLKASNTGAGEAFGFSVALSGETVLVGAPNESSDSVGVNGNQLNKLADFAGAAYLFARNGTNWTQQSYLKASNTGMDDAFGWIVALAEDLAVVGAPGEDSNASGVNGDQSDNRAPQTGAVYAFALANPKPQILTIVSDTMGGYLIHSDGAGGVTYHLERAEELNGPWLSVGTNTPITSGRMEFHDADAPTDQSFYRLQEMR